MLESKLQKKYDFYEFYSELKIPQENYESSVDHNNSLDNNSPSQLDFDLSCNDNNLNIENSTFIIKAPKASKILLILSIDKDLPSKIEKNIYSINFDYPVFQAISFMHESQNESILILTGSKNLVDKNEVFQIQIKQLMHEALYNLLKDIKNATKIIRFLSCEKNFSEAKHIPLHRPRRPFPFHDRTNDLRGRPATRSNRTRDRTRRKQDGGDADGSLRPRTSRRARA